MSEIFVFGQILNNFCAKFLITCLVSLNALPASATLYKFTFPSSQYDDLENPDVPGTLSGFIVIDSELAALDSRFANGNSGVSFDIPNWITQASLTFTSDGTAAAQNTSTETRTLFSTAPIDEIKWEPSSGAIDFSGNFVNQMSQFSLTNGGNFVVGSGMVQRFNFQNQSGQFRGGEFELVDPVTAVAVPGPLPILGLAPLAYYFRKLKKK